MYAIVHDGAVISLCDEPRYVRLVDEVWVEAKEAAAERVAVGGELYQLRDVLIRKVDGSEFVFGESIKLEAAEGNITDTQDALCEATEDFEQRIADIEDALCEITEMEG